MNQKEFESLISITEEATSNLLIRKGQEYASDTDRLANFKVNATRTGLSPLQVWAVYAYKHFDAIESYVKRVHACKLHPTLGQDMAYINATLSEPIQGRFHDAINYMYLGLALIQELNPQNPPEVRQEDDLELL